MTGKRQNPDDYTDEDVAHLFAQPQSFDDAEAFQERVSKALSWHLKLRKSLIGLAGLVGGVYALGQFVNVPLQTEGADSRAASAQMLKVTIGTEETFSRSLKIFDDLSHRLAEALQVAGGYIDLMHQPAFFWVSFSVCVTLLALYFMQGEEEVF